MKYILNQGAPIVVKADGLAAGKGVIVCRTVEEAVHSVDQIMVEKIFGDAGNRVVVEEYLVGEEASYIAFTDGKTILPMASSQDHKPVLDGDQGPNTGGMGAYSPAPVVTNEVHEKILEKVLRSNSTHRIPTWIVWSTLSPALRARSPNGTTPASRTS